MTDSVPLPESADVAIVGGGMVGLTLAVLLARGNSSLSIVVVEAVAMSPLASNGDVGGEMPPSFDARSTALSESTRQILQQGGVWSALAPNVCAIETIHVSDRGHMGATRMSARESGLEGLGYVVENRVLGRALYAAVCALDNISVVAPASVDRLVPRADGMELRCGDRVCVAGLAVIADGAESLLLQKLGIHTDITDYGQTALIANIALTEPHGGVAYERFTDEGPMALLPLPDADGEHRAALVWTLRPDHADQLLEADGAEFLRQLHQRFGFRAGRFARCGRRASYPLRLMVAEEQVRAHLAVVGNAAHFLHPVAGQGFNLAARDVARLSESVLSAVAAGKGPGDLGVLAAYLKSQQIDQFNTIGFSHNLPSVFANRSTGAAALRNMGLIAMDLLHPLRAEFARFGAGLVYPGSKPGGR